jgi:spore coat protein U-like protein
MPGVFRVKRSCCCNAVLRLCLYWSLMLVLSIASGPARGQTADLNVVATVEASCTLRGGTLDFGSYRTEEDKTAQATISYMCPEGMEIGLTLSQGRQPQGQERAMMRDDGREVLHHQLYQDAARSQVWGDQGDALTISSTADGDATVDVYGEIGAGQSVPPGTYRDTVLITLVVE